MYENWASFHSITFSTNSFLIIAYVLRMKAKENDRENDREKIERRRERERKVDGEI